MSETTLESLCETIVDCEHKTAPDARPGEEFAFSIGTSNIRRGRILLDSTKKVDRTTYESWTARATPHDGDLILTREAPVGEVGRVSDGIRVCLGQRTVLIRPDQSKVNNRYLHYLLLAPTAQDWMSSKASGSTVAHINVADVRNLPITALPIHSIQKAITALLGGLDDKITINERITDTASDLAKEHYWRETGQWSSTNEISLGDAARWYSGGTPSTTEPSYWNGDIPWISAASMKSTWIDSSDRMITDLGAENGTRMAPAHAILFVVRGMSLKSEFRVGITQRAVAFGQDCKALVANEGIDPFYLFYSIICRSEQILSLVDEAGHGTGRLATDRLAALRIPRPGETEQRRLADKLRPLAELAAARQQENRTLTALRDTLLPKLISGELRIRDAERQVGDVV